MELYDMPYPQDSVLGLMAFIPGFPWYVLIPLSLLLGYLAYRLGRRDAKAADEVKHLLRFITDLLEDFGLDDYYLELSTRDTEGAKSTKFIGSDEQWEKATAVLEQVGRESGLDLVPDVTAGQSYTWEETTWRWGRVVIGLVLLGAALKAGLPQ